MLLRWCLCLYCRSYKCHSVHKQRGYIFAGQTKYVKNGLLHNRRRDYGEKSDQFITNYFSLSRNVIPIICVFKH